MKVLIIGGGASGMMAALSASRDPGNTVTLLERQNRVGKKLLATGNGRCNLTNLHADVSHYHGADPAFTVPAMRLFGVPETLDFFRSVGLLTVAEASGKVYPLSDQANSVVDVLRFALEARGVNVVCSCDVVDVHKKARGIEAVSATGEKHFGDRLIVACGGAAGKKLGGSKAGYHLLGLLGHSCTELLPCLTQIKTDVTYVRALKGVRADALVRLRVDGRTVAESSGEVQFADFGLTGPVAFELSRAAATTDGKAELCLDLLRGYEKDAVLSLLRAKKAAFPALAAEELFSGMLPSRLGKVLVRRAGLDCTAPLSALSEDALSACVSLVKFFTLPVEGVMGFDSAQVTAGGVPTSEFHADTLESRLMPNVFATGEVLDIDGDCGGFNLQWAWSSGYLAGRLGKGADT